MDYCDTLDYIGISNRDCGLNEGKIKFLKGNYLVQIYENSSANKMLTKFTHHLYSELYCLPHYKHCDGYPIVNEVRNIVSRES